MDYNNYIIRKLNENDYLQYKNLINKFRDTIFDEIQFKEILKKMINYSDIWIIELNNEIISSATILYEYKFIHNISKIAHIEDVCTLKKYRGHGFGKILIKHIINESKNNNCYKITLYCKDELENFYNVNNFEKKGIQMAIYF
jgi:glucosamine-phosphate N-acetyltransferase